MYMILNGSLIKVTSNYFTAYCKKCMTLTPHIDINFDREECVWCREEELTK
jgi:hypothetical protein